MSLDSLKNQKVKDKIFCKSISKSIADIILYSMDDEFRKKSFKLFDVHSTRETEKEIYRRLKLITKGGKNFGSLKDTEEFNLNTNALPIIPTDSLQVCNKNHTQCPSDNPPKRKKLTYYSQPVYNNSKQLTDYSTCNLSSTNATELTSSLESTISIIYQDNFSQHTESIKDENNYYKTKFENLFNGDVSKYLKRN